MRGDWTFLVVLLLCNAGRIPRIVERWKAPFLNGPGWFFGIEVAPDFAEGAGREILAKYRLRLFLLWTVELPVSIALAARGHWTAVFLLVIGFVLMTRVAYYANRKMAEDAARHYQILGTEAPVWRVALSLEPRRLRDYTNPWIEGGIAAILLVSLAGLVYARLAPGGWQPLHGFWSMAAMILYFQLGLLLMKVGLVRARAVAPAENAESYLLWRESLRRLSTTLCDYLRLGLLFPLLLPGLAFLIDRGKGNALATLESVFAFVVAPALGWCEWRRRQQHLKIARAAKPTGFLVRPDSTSLERLVCFRPSLPALLLRGPKGYALNLASASAMTAGLYVAGCAALLFGLSR